MKVPVKILIIDLILFLICIPGIIQIENKAGMPLMLASSENTITAAESYPPLIKNDMILSINDLPVTNIHMIEFFMDLKNVGDIVRVNVLRNNTEYSFNISLEKSYTTAYTISVIITGLCFFIIGILILLKGTDKQVSTVFHWAAVSTAVILFCTWGNVNTLPFNLGYIVRYFFHAGYVMVAALFVHFSYLFPLNRSDKRRFVINSFYGLAVTVFVYLSYTFTVAAREGSYDAIINYLDASNVMRVFVIAGIILSVVTFSRSYYLDKSISGRKKLKWILFGFVIGPVAYMLMWLLPQALNIVLVPEITVLFLMLAVPVTFAISIIKYRLFDIDIVLNRSIVYTLSLTGLIAIYLAIVYLISDYIITAESIIPSGFAVTFVAILFHPLKTRIQKFVDLKFFRVQYDFKNAVNKFFAGLQQSNDHKSVMEFIVNETDKLIPLREAGVILFDSSERKITHFYHKGFHLLENDSSMYRLLTHLEDISVPAAISSKIEGGISIKAAGTELQHYYGIIIIIPFMTDDKVSGYFIAGRKKSDQRYSAEDIELMKMIIIRSSLELQRIKMNQQLLYEQIRSEKLQELDKLKSFFISSTAHELKTPLTSIRLFSEMIERPAGYKQEYLDTIKGECDRLTRLIDNLLDISKIEQNEKRYLKEDIQLKELVRKSLSLMEYQFKLEDCTVSFEPCHEEVFISADADAVTSALINIYSNALKYSRSPKKIKVSITTGHNEARISVKDNGIGISEEDKKNILEPYYRSTLVKNKNFIGTGIGLALVKHIMEGHNGTILIESTPGEGSTFTLVFTCIFKQKSISQRTASDDLL